MLMVLGEYWIVNQILSKGLHNGDNETLTYTTTLMDKLEQVWGLQISQRVHLEIWLMGCRSKRTMRKTMLLWMIQLAKLMSKTLGWKPFSERIGLFRQIRSLSMGHSLY